MRSGVAGTGSLRAAGLASARGVTVSLMVALLCAACATDSDQPVVLYRFIDHEGSSETHLKKIDDLSLPILDPWQEENVFELPSGTPQSQLRFRVGFPENSAGAVVRFEITQRRGDAEPVSIFEKEVSAVGWSDEELSIAGDATPTTLTFRRTLLKGPIERLLRTGWGNPMLVTGRERADRPSVILVSLDTLRADRVGTYGHPGARTPTLDRLAAEGVAFESAYSPSTWTMPSHASLFYGVHSFAFPDDFHKWRLPDWPDPSTRPLAEVFRDAGYLTAGFTGGGLLSELFGFADGFDTYFAYEPSGGKTAWCPPDRLDGAEVFERTRRWLDRNSSLPFFLFVHTYDVHDVCPFRKPSKDPWAPPPDLDPEGQKQRAAYYDQMVASVDELLGDLLAQLEELGIAQDTLLIVTSDHGEGFWEHGENGHGEWMKLYEEIARVPLLLHWPARLPAGVRVEDPVSLVGLAPTILALAGLPEASWMDEAPLPGLGLENPPPQVVIAQSGRWMAVRAGRHKLLTSLENDGTSDELYDLRDDPKERVNLVDRLPDVHRELRRHADRHRERIASWTLPPAEPVELDEATLQRLRDLGYLQ
ncbi:MAG: sulfatase [Myxococcota bacterium]